MPDAADPLTLAVLVLLAAACGWSLLQIQALNRRLTALERQHLALVADLEERLFEPVPPS